MNPLALSEAEYRQVYERIVQLALDYLSGLDQRSCFPGVSGVEATNLFAESLPELGMGAAALDDLTKVVAASRAQGPRFCSASLVSEEVSTANSSTRDWRSRVRT